MSDEGNITHYLTLEELARLPDLELQARALAGGMQSGIHPSPYRGSNVEFKEHRQYAHGDRLQDIDWKAYARSDRLHVRLREEDTNLSTCFILDRSASMDFKSPGVPLDKYRFARIVTAAMLFYLSHQHDAAALALLGEDLTEPGKPSSAPHRYRQLLALLAGAAAEHATHWEALGSGFVRQLRPRSLVTVVSDFTVRAARLLPFAEALKEKRCELLLFHVFAPAERELPDDPTLRLEEAETGARLTLTPELIRDEYRELFQKHLEALADLALSTGGGYLPLCTDRLPLDIFGAWLRQREKERRRR